MARTTLWTKVGLDKTAWDRGLKSMQRDARNFARNLPRTIIGGVAAGAGLGLGLGAIRGGISRAFETARGARAAADLTEENVTAGQFWKLQRDAAEEMLGPEITGGMSNIARVQKQARGLDEGAIESVARFFGGERKDPYRAFDQLIRTYTDAPDVIKREMRQLFPMLENQRVIELGSQIISESRRGNQELEDAVNTMIKIEERWLAIEKALGEGALVEGAKQVAPFWGGVKNFWDFLGGPFSGNWFGRGGESSEQQGRLIGKEAGREINKSFER